MIIFFFIYNIAFFQAWKAWRSKRSQPGKHLFSKMILKTEGKVEEGDASLPWSFLNVKSKGKNDAIKRGDCH